MDGSRVVEGLTDARSEAWFKFTSIAEGNEMRGLTDCKVKSSTGFKNRERGQKRVGTLENNQAITTMRGTC